jgi:hypothetical protein
MSCLHGSHRKVLPSAFIGSLQAGHRGVVISLIQCERLLAVQSHSGQEALAREGLPPTASDLFSRLHFGVLRKLEPFASNAKPYFLIERIYELLG